MCDSSVLLLFAIRRMPSKFSLEYDNLTEAVARAKKVCRLHAQQQSPVKIASKIPKIQNKRGRPKGSKDSKPRNKKQSTSKSASSELASNHDRACVSVEFNAANEGLIEYPIEAEEIFRDYQPSLFDSLVFQSEADDSTEQPTIYTDLHNSIPDCWAFPLP